MAQPDTKQSDETPDIDEAFAADRQIFWSRFTTFTAGAVVVVVVLLMALLVFVA